MRKRIAACGSGIAALGIVALTSTSSWAAGPIDTGSGIAVTISNPAAATVTLGATSLAVDATVNTDATHEAPSNLSTSAQIGQGGISVQVQSNNGHGYSVQLDGPAGGFTSPGLTAMPNADFHVTSLTVDTNGNPVPHTSDLSSPVTILSNNGPSGSVWDANTNPLPGAASGTDETRVAGYVQPNVLVGGASYSGSIEAFYIPTA